MFCESFKMFSIRDIIPCDRDIPPLKEKGGNMSLRLR